MATELLVNTTTKILNNRFRKANESIRQSGIAFALRDELERSGYVISAHYASDETQHVLQNEPAIVITNHPHLIEPIAAISTLTERKNNDIYLMARNDLGNILGKNINDHLIPIYGLDDKQSRHFYPLLSSIFENNNQGGDNVNNLNAHSLCDGVDKIKNGGVVFICPSGGTKDEGAWQEGIGLMIKMLARQSDCGRFKLISSYVQGTIKNDPLYIFSRTGRLVNRNIDVHYSPPLSVDTLTNNGTLRNRKEITFNVMQYYIDSFEHLRISL